MKLLKHNESFNPYELRRKYGTPLMIEESKASFRAVKITQRNDGYE